MVTNHHTCFSLSSSGGEYPNLTLDKMAGEDAMNGVGPNRLSRIVADRARGKWSRRGACNIRMFSKKKSDFSGLPALL